MDNDGQSIHSYRSNSYVIFEHVVTTHFRKQSCNLYNLLSLLRTISSKRSAQAQPTVDPTHDLQRLKRM
jgi:hypothetical protein